MSYIFGIENGLLINYHWGKRVNNFEVGDLVKNPTMVWSTSEDVKCLELPVYGRGDYRSPMIELEFENGSRTTDFIYKSHNIYDGKPKLNGLPAKYVEDEKETQTLEIVMYDELENIELILLYSAFSSGEISRSIKLKNKSEKKIKIKRILSASVDFYDDKFETITLQGAWARERRIERSRLFHGAKTVSSCRGASSHNKNPFMALVRPHTTETQGHML